jgi:hypothetical protein
VRVRADGRTPCHQRAGILTLVEKIQLLKIAEFLSDGRIIYPVYQKSLPRLCLPGYQFNLAYFHSEKLGQNSPNGLVGLAFFGRGRHLNFERVAQHSHDAIAR